MKKVDAIYYDVYATPNPDSEGESLYHVRPVTMGAHMNEIEMMEYLQRNTRTNTSQFVGVVEALKQEIPEQLLSNKRVHIKGMGTFYLQIGIRRRKDKQGRWYKPKFASPDEITARDLCVEGIGFKADPSWNDLVKHTTQPFDRSPYAPHAQQVDTAQLLVWLDNMTNKSGGATCHDVRRRFGTTDYHARKLLNALCEGDQPKLYREKVGSTYVYKRWGKS